METMYFGTFYYSNGDRLVSPALGCGYDANFNIKGNGNYYYIRKNGETIVQVYSGTQKTREFKLNKEYYIEEAMGKKDVP